MFCTKYVFDLFDIDFTADSAHFSVIYFNMAGIIAHTYNISNSFRSLQ